MATVQLQTHTDGVALVRKTHHHTYVVKTRTTGHVVYRVGPRMVAHLPQTKATRELMRAQHVLSRYLAQYAAALAVGNSQRARELPHAIRFQLATL